MSGYHRIVCTEQTGCSQGGHIVAVGVGTDPNAASNAFTVAQVYAAMDSGSVFYTEANGYTARVHKYRCGCGLGSLRSAADATASNNLDNLRLCAWKAA